MRFYRLADQLVQFAANNGMPYDACNMYKVLCGTIFIFMMRKLYLNVYHFFRLNEDKQSDPNLRPICAPFDRLSLCFFPKELCTEKTLLTFKEKKIEKVYEYLNSMST